MSPAFFILSNLLETVGVESEDFFAICRKDARPSAFNSFKMTKSIGSSFNARSIVILR